MGKPAWSMRACIVTMLWATTAIALLAQTTAIVPAVAFTTLHHFNRKDGQNPWAGLVQGTDGNFYGTTYYGGANDVCNNPFGDGCGEVFKVTPSGKLTVIHSFDGTDGRAPSPVLVLAVNGDLYGTTYTGGTHGIGTIFKITTDGTLTTLYNFYDGFFGALPEAGLVLGADGNFYGTTYEGGTFDNECLMGCGTVFKVTPKGKLTTLHSFDKKNGSFPEAPLVQATDGNFYGTTLQGGGQGCHNADGCGTIFKITPTGAFTELFRFDGPNGGEPGTGALLQGADGNLYGTTFAGGGNGNGTVFRITTSDKLTTLYRFCSQSGCADGAGPYAGLIQGTGGNLYGTTEVGGTGACGDITCGTVFKISRSGQLVSLHSFNTSEGANPIAGLLQGTNGTFYGTTESGGTAPDCKQFGCGSVFSLSIGLAPFVRTVPTVARTGAAVDILGTDLTGATSVTFDGTPATFTVVSGTEITTTVPAGATTGSVQVVTPGGTLSSNVPFRLLP
jgi:uncharacterized repeat protein (TIGR03803 family)